MNNRVKITVLLFILLTINLPGKTQEIPVNGNFVPHGSAFGKIFTNFHIELDGNEKESAFAVERAYLGYNYSLTSACEAFVKIDIGSPNDVSEYSKIRRYAYFKNAGFRIKNDRFTWAFGLIDTRQLSLQEKVWAHRYIMKSYQDQYAFGPKADLGTYLFWQFTPWLSADISLLNGEGYKQLQLDNTFKNAIGITIMFSDHITGRIYGDLMDKEVIISNLAFFLSWQGERINAGAEFNYRFNDNYIENHDMWGTSLYGMYAFTQKIEIFARYDYLTSNPTEIPDVGWNYNNDGTALIAGIQFHPFNRFNVALDYQDWYPWPKNFENRSFLFLNFEITL